MMRRVQTKFQHGQEAVRRRTSPLVRKWLREYGIQASRVTSSLCSERISIKDVQHFMADEGDTILRSSIFPTDQPEYGRDNEP
jgi:pyruvate/2-oxoglutarate dehydrogenase complex dihydrolipoamide acyltransferase (E2) component